MMNNSSVLSEPRCTALSVSLPVFAPPCEETTWFVAGLMGWNVTGYVFICLIWSSGLGWGGNKRVKERQRGGEVSGSLQLYTR